jgi:hypothetical protein
LQHRRLFGVQPISVGGQCGQQRSDQQQRGLWQHHESEVGTDVDKDCRKSYAVAPTSIASSEGKSQINQQEKKGVLLYYARCPEVLGMRRVELSPMGSNLPSAARLLTVWTCPRAL